METPGSKRTPSPLFDKFDWFFSGCPEDQIRFCHDYEYHRELKDEHFPLIGWRREAKLDDFERLLHFVREPRSLSSMRFNCNLYPFYLYPEWPDRPYLTIDPEERRRRLQLLWGRSRLRSHFALATQYTAVKECAEKVLEPEELPIVNSGSDVVFPLRLSSWEPKETWLQQIREVLDYLDGVRGDHLPAIKADIERKKPLFGHLKSELKALGGFRLINHCGGVDQKNGDLPGRVTEAAARKCEQAHLPPLYGTHRRWRAAFTLAQENLKFLRSILRRTA
jgi:hypothetical protein